MRPATSPEGSDVAAGAAELVCVYRRRHAGLVAELVADADRHGIKAQLWALESTAPELARWTRGEGPGQRLDLLNRLLENGDPGLPLLIADDDISLESGDLGLLLRRARQARLSLAQPAHADGSFVNHWVTRHRAGSRVRLTRFVEVGPLVFMAPSARALLTPFPVEFGMGWGLDVVWSDLQRAGHRFGVVDDVTLWHHEEAASSYSREQSMAQLDAVLSDRGLASVRELNQVMAVWPKLAPVPVWVPTRSAVRLALGRKR